MARGDDITFGEISGYPDGSMFTDRGDLQRRGLHRRTQHGISGLEGIGADAIVLNGGYKADDDRGDVIIYTGEGGRDPSTGRIVEDQDYTAGNQALVDSQENYLPVRVIRGYRADNKALRPTTGYRYDGLYEVVWNRREPSPDGPLICRYRLEKIGVGPVAIAEIEAEAEGRHPAAGGPAARAASLAMRLIRRAELVDWVKRLYDYHCQICGERIDLPGGARYAECAHIQPLGLPHSGPDDPGNVLCLCPNDHVRLDRGTISLSVAGEVIDCATLAMTGTLTLKRPHSLLASAVDYHRGLWLP
jgi:putative restriction endonuclease